MAKDSPQSKYSEQYILNNIYDQVLRAIAVIGVGYDGVNSQVPLADALATKITTVGAVTYIGVAAPGTAQSSALWQAKKIDSSTPNETLILWADGDAQFNNVSSDLTALSYS